MNFYEKALFVKSRRGGCSVVNAATLCPSRYASIRCELLLLILSAARFVFEPVLVLLAVGHGGAF
jgi:hypothetical protein